MTNQETRTATGERSPVTPRHGVLRRLVSHQFRGATLEDLLAPETGEMQPEFLEPIGAQEFDDDLSQRPIAQVIRDFSTDFRVDRR
jgi:hypothetical protein